jgi:hypothetical protein
MIEDFIGILDLRDLTLQPSGSQNNIFADRTYPTGHFNLNPS